MGSVIPGKARVTSGSFHDDGVHLFLASESNNKLQIIDCQSGKSKSLPLSFQREGISLVEAT